MLHDVEQLDARIDVRSRRRYCHSGTAGEIQRVAVDLNRSVFCHAQHRTSALNFYRVAYIDRKLLAYARHHSLGNVSRRVLASRLLNIIARLN